MLKRFELNRLGVSELMRSPEMLSIIAEKGHRVQKKVGSGYEFTSLVGRNRVNVRIETKTRKAMLDNKKRNTLLKALRNC